MMMMMMMTCGTRITIRCYAEYRTRYTHIHSDIAIRPEDDG